MKKKISEEQVKHAKRIFNNHRRLYRATDRHDAKWFAKHHALKTVREVLSTLVTDRAINYWKGIKWIISDMKTHKLS